MRGRHARNGFGNTVVKSTKEAPPKWGYEPVAKVEEFRNQAAVCLDRAKVAANLKAKLELLMIAVAWLDLADLLEQGAAGRALGDRTDLAQPRSDSAHARR